MTRDEARAHWAASGLRYEDMTEAALKRLRERIDEALRASGLIDEYRATRAPRIHRTSRWFQAEILCRAYYFYRREAVTFNSDGFIGFAGWADSQNVQPILTAFCGWVDDQIAKRAAPEGQPVTGADHG